MLSAVPVLPSTALQQDLKVSNNFQLTSLNPRTKFNTGKQKYPVTDMVKYNVWHQSEITRQAEKQGNATYNEEENQLVKSKPELVVNDIQIVKN